MKDKKKQLKITHSEPSMVENEQKKAHKGFGFGSAEIEIVDDEAFKELLVRKRRTPDLESIIRIKRGK